MSPPKLATGKEWLWINYDWVLGSARLSSKSSNLGDVYGNPVRRKNKCHDSYKIR